MENHHPEHCQTQMEKENIAQLTLTFKVSIQSLLITFHLPKI